VAVFTEVPVAEAAALIDRLGIGQLTRLEPCPGGIENTNYFADTTTGNFVLTLFERLTFEQLPYYLHLMKHLAQRGIPVPEPRADVAGAILHRLCGKPAAIVNRLEGQHNLHPDASHCASVGSMLARLHLAGLDFPMSQPNLRGLAWWRETVPLVVQFLEPGQAELIESELAFQSQLAQSTAHAALPRGAIHADLFRDNAMFDGEALTGLFDFYFAGVDAFVFDLAVCLNDWCTDPERGTLDEARAVALVAAYDAARPLAGGELRLLPAMMRAAALRFWVSRLWDLHLPRSAQVLQPRDPTLFERILRARIESPWHYLRT
jgi:homoserine kinase type II